MLCESAPLHVSLWVRRSPCRGESTPNSSLLRDSTQPISAEFFAGEAGLSSELSNLGWECIVHEREVDKPRWGDKLRREDAIFWTEDFIELDESTQLLNSKKDYTFAWFANPCTTFGPLGCAKHGWGADGSKGTTAEAHAANLDLERTCTVIYKKSFSASGNRNFFTFAIENPTGKLVTMECMKKLLADEKLRACVVRVDQCRFGAFRAEEMMGRYQKPTHIITNNPGIIYDFGIEIKTWYPDAPSPRYTCSKGAQHMLTPNHHRRHTHAVASPGCTSLMRRADPSRVSHADSPCQQFKNHSWGVRGAGERANELGDVEPSRLAPYPTAFSSAIAIAVDRWWRSNVAPSHLE